MSWVLVSIVGALVIAVTVLAVRLAAVSSHADQIASCVNTDLGKRNAPAARDAAAHIAFAKAVKGLFDVPPGATPQQRLQVAEKFQRQVSAYVRVLLADQKAREKNPLGQC
jgi:hypothetical protein